MSGAYIFFATHGLSFSQRIIKRLFSKKELDSISRIWTVFDSIPTVFKWNRTVFHPFPTVSPLNGKKPPKIGGFSSFYSLANSGSATFTSCLPRFVPLNKPRNASGVFSKPSTIVSSYFNLPSCSHCVNAATPVGKSFA